VTTEGLQVLAGDVDVQRRPPRVFAPSFSGVGLVLGGSFVANGDSAIAGVQYSYLPSWISLLADQDAVKETSRVVFRTIHDYWATLPASRARSSTSTGSRSARSASRSSWTRSTS
jgi:hypothetical protein